MTEANTPLTKPAPAKAPAPVASKPAPVAEPTTVEPTPPPPPAAVVKETRAPAMPASSFEDTVTDLKETGTENQKALIAAMELYIQRMAPRVPIEPADGARAQYTLWKALRTVTHDVPVGEFKVLWLLVLHYFDAHKQGVFSEKHAHRFNDAWTYDVNELAAYNSLLNLIRLTSDPRSRATGLKQINLKTALNVGFGETARQRLIGFYQ